ncbi:unnamed protein product [Caenorhabditis nigoni]
MYSIPLLVLAISSITGSTESNANFFNTDKIDNRFLRDAPTLDLSFVSNAVGNSPTPEVIENLARLARVVTAVSVQIGLSDGSIPVDDVIAELLNIEPKDLKNLETFDPKNSEQFFSELKGMKQSDNVEDEKNALVKMFDLKKLWKTVDLSNLPDDASYKKLDGLKSINLSGIKDLKIADTQKLLKKESLSDSEVTTVKASLTALVAAVESIKVSPDDYIPTLEKLKPLSSLGEALSFYADYSLLNYNNMPSKNQDSLKTDFEALKKFNNLSGPSSLDTISRFVSSRFIYHRTIITHTSGFVNGFKDLGTLEADRSDKWIQEVVKYDLSPLKEFDRIGTEVTELDGKWNSVSTYSTYTSLKLISDFHKSIARDLPSQDDLVSVMNGITACSTAPVKNTLTEKINKISGNVGILLKKLSAVRRMQTSITVVKTQMLPKLSTKTSEEELKQMNELLMKLETDSRIVKEGVSFDEIDMMTTKSDDMIIFKEKHPGHITAFNCIRDLDNGLEKVASAARALIKVDQIQKNTKVLENVQTTSTAISDAAGSFKTIRSTLESIKKSMDPKLKDLSNLKNVSKPFGEAVAALVLSDVVSRKSSDFETFVSNGYLIANQVDADRSSEFKKEFRAEWGDFRSTAQDINSMFVGITNWMEKIKASNSSLPLSKTVSIFEMLPNLVDVDLKTDHRLNAIYISENEQSAKVDKKLLEEFKKSLLDLSKLDLKFARFQSSATQMPDTITRLLKILEEAKAEETASLKDDEEKSNKTMWIIIIIGGIVLIVIVLAIGLWRALPVMKEVKNHLKGEKRKRDEAAQSKTVPAVNKTAPPTNTLANVRVTDETKNSKPASSNTVTKQPEAQSTGTTQNKAPKNDDEKPKNEKHAKSEKGKKDEKSLKTGRDTQSTAASPSRSDSNMNTAIHRSQCLQPELATGDHTLIDGTLDEVSNKFRKAGGTDFALFDRYVSVPIYIFLRWSDSSFQELNRDHIRAKRLEKVLGTSSDISGTESSETSNETIV